MRLLKGFAVAAAAGVLALTLATPSANASTIDFDFTTLGGNNTSLGNTVTVSGVKATGYQFSGGHLSNAPLWLRDQNNDHGLGVCSNGENCAHRGGDVNELDNHGNYEAIVLDKGAGNSRWTSLWVSSLDNNSGGNTVENGTLFWADSTDLSTLDFSNHFGFSYGDFGSDVEGDILTLTAASGFDSAARYVGFVAGCVAGGCYDTNNDYLVYKGAVDVPEPSLLGLFGLSLLGIGLVACRRRV